LAVVVVGVAHFVAPRYFDSINRLGFPNRARTFTYVNGAVETIIGVLLALTRARRQSTVVSACYVAYLTIAILNTQLRIRRVRAVA
jgi:uncharacterized membrane protein